MQGALFILGGLAFGAWAVSVLGRNGLSSVVNVVNDLPKHPYKRYGTRTLSQIRYLVIHHSGGFNQSVEAIARYHVGPNHISSEGIPGIAYHFYITEDGTTFQTNELETVSWHVGGNNTASVGICMSGNFNGQPPSQAQLQSALSLVASLVDKLGNVEVKGHRDFSNTSCPGQFTDLSIFDRFG